jgi:type VI secretion system protein VasG
VQLHEPTVSEAVTILRGLAQVYEKSHGIYLRDDAVVAAAELSARYLAGRQLPDKAVDVLDTACARVRISLAAAPESLSACVANWPKVAQRQALRRDAEAGLRSTTKRWRRWSAPGRSRKPRGRAGNLWTEQRKLAEQVLELRQQLANAAVAPAAPAEEGEARRRGESRERWKPLAETHRP